MASGKGISSFSVVLLMSVAAFVGVVCFSHLKVQYTPVTEGKTITIGYSYPGASARVVESEVTSKLEGVFSTIKQCRSISSLSSNERGSVSLEINKHADMEAVRFEVASLIRNTVTSLPKGCSYPSISLNSKGEKSQTGIAFSVRSSLPSKDIAGYVEDYLMYPLSIIEGVSSVSFSGDTDYELVVTFDASLVETLGISAAEISAAFKEYYSEAMIGMTETEGNTYSVRLKSRSSDDPASIPVKKVGERVVYLGDIASFSYKEALPTSYSRINGLNTLFLMVDVASDANLIGVVDEVKKTVAGIQSRLPEEIGISVSYDYSESISEELSKIYKRTLLCLLILLVFVFAVNRSWRYMTVIAITLAVNLLISITFYYLTGLNIHIYTLAGVTVSLGIIIDNSIVMIDHYSRCHNRKVFPSLLSAVFTTVVSLMVVFLLPESEKASLSDFSIVIAINLLVSLLVSYLFVPALLDFFHIENSTPDAVRFRRLRRTARWNMRYSRYIAWAARHRWVLILLLVASFGIPTFLIPSESEADRKLKDNFYGRAVGAIVSWKPYADNKSQIDKWIGSSFALFNRSTDRFDFYREPQRTTLYIRAEMPEGCSVQQLNEVMRSMENYLAGVEEIDVFETRISSYRYGSITVLFKPEYENTAIPSYIKSNVVTMAANFGGANWVVTGVDNTSFNNNIVTDVKNYSISLSGYNYDALLGYAQNLVDYLSEFRRISHPEIWGSDWSDRPITEFNMRYDFEMLSSMGISPYEYYFALLSPLYDSYVSDGVRIVSSDKEEFDLWHIGNAGRSVGEGRMKLSEAGEISKDRSGLVIRKQDQAYTVNVRYDFIGAYNLADELSKQAETYMNTEVLPLGYKAKYESRGWYYDNQEKYAALILLVIACIFVALAVHFNSLRYPLAIILLIPISFIGVFLVFGLTNFIFDKGGFAAFVMLCGITVNAGIYLVSEWLMTGRDFSVKDYVRAFNHKIWPISLTILSTILGLVPFLFDGPKEVFWFCFAVGTISGLVFSVIAMIFYLPPFVLKKPQGR